MKIDPLAASNARAAGAAQLLLLQGDGDFAARLTLGQIIKGRVLQSYEGQRYSVDFDGRQKIVDSAVPLTTGELLHGRVVGLGEQVTLQRVMPPAANGGALPPDAARTAARDDIDTAIAALFERHQVQLQPDEWSTLQRVAARSPEPQQAGLAALVLNKLGLAVTPELLRALHATLSKRDATSAFPLPAQALALVSTRGASEHDTTGLADWLSRAVIDLPEARLREGRADADRLDADDGDGTPGDGRRGRDVRPGPEADVARWILNAQTGGSVAHRVATLPLLFDGELVELDIALFAQTGDGGRQDGDGIRHRELVFALDTRELGHLEIRALLANGHASLDVAADFEAASAHLAAHAEALADSLERIGWRVDAQRYASGAGRRNGVLSSVVEHLISPGSVSRLL